MLQEIRKAAATIYGWECPLLTLIYPGFDCGSSQDTVCGVHFGGRTGKDQHINIARVNYGICLFREGGSVLFISVGPPANLRLLVENPCFWSFTNVKNAKTSATCPAKKKRQHVGRLKKTYTANAGFSLWFLSTQVPCWSIEPQPRASLVHSFEPKPGTVGFSTPLRWSLELQPPVHDFDRLSLRAPAISPRAPGNARGQPKPEKTTSRNPTSQRAPLQLGIDGIPFVSESNRLPSTVLGKNDDG